ncbi:PAQR family membrane homeostasis protein TrhA [Nigerium massiliense]|uniref:PAQR family membrane homeostasis protein TrhA n=1 Tax=Nigerium massiliense TaxID=1522317 RepID=UPI000694B51E|nr:hemolysin III family protein [Nigerium massiliense]
MNAKTPTLAAPEHAAESKPRWRGWIHTVMAPLALLAGLVLLVLTPTVGGRVAVAVYVLSSLALFGNSAVYHRGSWSGRVAGTLRRVDHANIFVFIAGTYTPLAVNLLDGPNQRVLLLLVWSCALLGVLFRVFWLSAPRLLYTLLYVVMGWSAAFWLPQFWVTGGPAVVWLIIAGGLVYTAGAVVYGLKRPDPSPAWFGYHEIFHACTAVAAACHFVAICLAMFR